MEAELQWGAIAGIAIDPLALGDTRGENADLLLGFVAGLLRAQLHGRQESALEWRIRRANLPERWSLESFPWARQPGVDRKQMCTFAELDFVAQHENLVLTGPTGVAKPDWLAGSC